LSCDIAEKSAVNELTVRLTVVPPPEVVLVELDEGFDELPHAERVKATTATVAMAATRVLEKECLFGVPNRESFTSVSCRKSRGRGLRTRVAAGVIGL
jgi:hypothetical protein